MNSIMFVSAWKRLVSLLCGCNKNRAKNIVALLTDKKKTGCRETSAGKVARVWDKKGLSRESNRKLNWMDFSIIEECINERITKDPNKNWMVWVKKNYCQEKKTSGLVLGCGDGALERHGISLGICDHFDAIDISRKSVEFARTLAAETGLAKNITYQISDINQIKLPKDKYDLVFCSMCLHHFLELEHIFKQVKNSLKPGGLFIFNEFVGPSRFQWRDKQLDIANQILRLLPDKYCRDLSCYSLVLKQKIIRPSIDDMIRIDPSEAIRSEEIISLVGHYFRILEKVDYGGTLLQILLHNIVGNFDLRKEEDVSILKLLYNLEMLLIEEGGLKSDFTVVVAAGKG